MHVLHVLNELRPSGAEVMLQTSAALWRERGIVGSILATGEAVGSFAPALSEAGFNIHHRPFEPSMAYLREVRRLLTAGEYQVMHIHTERAGFWFGAVGVLAPGVGVVRTVHNVFSFDRLLRVERILQRNLLRAGGARSISVGPTVRDNERQRFWNPTTYVPNWVDTDRFVPPSAEIRAAARARLGIGDQQRFVISSIGNCNDVKNHVATLRALGDLDGRYDWLYLHAGEEDAAQDERRVAEQLGIVDRCRFLGHVSDVVPMLHASDVFVMPSLYEGLGNAALEALATGLPCILAASPGLHDLRTTITTGIVWVEPSPTGVKEGLLQVMARPQGPTALEQQAAHGAVERHHGVAVGTRGYLRTYRQVSS